MRAARCGTLSVSFGPLCVAGMYRIGVLVEHVHQTCFVEGQLNVLKDPRKKDLEARKKEMEAEDKKMRMRKTKSAMF